MDETTTYIVLDGECVTCQALYHALVGRRTDVKFTTLQQVALKVPVRFLFVVQNGQLLWRSEAVIAVLSLRWSMVKWLRFIPLRWRDGAYLYVARYRYCLLGRTDECLVPQLNERENWITEQQLRALRQLIKRQFPQ